MKQMTNFDKVEDFHRAFGSDIDAEWTPTLLKMRRSLITEEYEEVLEEISGCIDDAYFGLDPKRGTRQKAFLTKELCDLLYVVYGTAIALGLPLEPAFNRVHQANMSKLGADGKPVYREDGKVMKSSLYEAAKLDDLFD